MIHTAGRPHHIELSTKRESLVSDRKDLAYVTLKIVDKDGRLCPQDGRLVYFQVDGEGRFRAAANGDPTCLDLFHLPQMHVFNGMLTLIVQSGKKEGYIKVKATSPGINAGMLQLKVK